MGYTCVAPGCRSGYPPRRGDPSPPPPASLPVSMHNFPRDPTLREAWVQAIPRTHYTLSPHLRICSRHFLPNDFITTSLDCNITRRQRKALLAGNLKVGHPMAVRKRLKPGAIPSLWPDLPAPSSTEESQDPLGQHPRRKVATLPPETLPKVDIPANNRVLGLAQVAEQLDELAHLKHVNIVQNSDYFIFMRFDPPDSYRPNRVRYSMTLFPDLSFKLEYQNLPFSRDLVASVTTKKRIEFFHEIGGILNILERVGIQSDSNKVELARVIRDFQTNMSQFTFTKPKLWSKIQDALAHLKVQNGDEAMTESEKI